VTNAEKLQMASAFGDMTADLAALRLSRDQMAHQLSVTIAERDAERRLSDALAEALRTHKTLDCWDCYDDAALTQFAKARGSHA
jgi:hypothetical protein